MGLHYYLPPSLTHLPPSTQLVSVGNPDTPVVFYFPVYGRGTLPYHWAFAVASLQPFMLPGGHARSFEFFPDHPLLRPVLDLLQSPGGQLRRHIIAKNRKKDQHYTEDPF